MNYILAFAAALVASTSFTPAARDFSVKVGLVDHPGPRKVHTTPMPLFGGAAVYLSIVFAIAAFVTDEAWSQMAGILVASTLAVVVGVLDDRGLLHHQVKLVVAMPLAALILIATDMHSEMFHQLETVPWVGVPGTWLDYALSFVWFVGIMAAFSILDHMDGLCAGIAAIAAAFFLYFAVSGGQVLVGSLAAAMLGASIGFLCWNFNPSRIFLGDGGAMLLGLIVATLGIKLRFPEVAPTTSWMIPVLVLGVPIFDTTLVTISRGRRGLVPFSSPGKDHTAHRLTSLGLGHRRAVLTLYGAAVAFGVLACVVPRLDTPQAVMVAGAVTLAALVIIVALEQTPFER